MARSARTTRLFGRQHGATQMPDRRALEAAGWRTTLEYRENHVRRRDGRLTHLEVIWIATAEREIGLDDGGADGTVGVGVGGGNGGPLVVSATASTVEKVWSRLRTQAELVDVRTPTAPTALRAMPA